MKKKRIFNYILILLIGLMIFNISAEAAGLSNSFILGADCPLGENVTKDLSGALKIFKIVAPILCIAFSIFEAIQAITKGDAATDLKRVAIRFGKRMIYTVLIFFLAVIVDAVMQLLNVWDADGQCSFTEEAGIMIHIPQ